MSFLVPLCLSVSVSFLDLSASKIFFDSVQWAGGGYLIYLGINAIKKSKVHAHEMLGVSGAKPSIFKSLKDGFVVGILNPKGIVFNAAVTPQFIDRDSGRVVLQLILLGAIFAVLAFICDGTWGILAGTARNWLATNVRRIIFLRSTGGVVMMILGLLVLIQIN